MDKISKFLLKSLFVKNKGFNRTNSRTINPINIMNFIKIYILSYVRN